MVAAEKLADPVRAAAAAEKAAADGVATNLEQPLEPVEESGASATAAGHSADQKGPQDPDQGVKSLGKFESQLALLAPQVPPFCLTPAPSLLSPFLTHASRSMSVTLQHECATDPSPIVWLQGIS